MGSNDKLFTLPSSHGVHHQLSSFYREAMGPCKQKSLYLGIRHHLCASFNVQYYIAALHLSSSLMALQL